MDYEGEAPRVRAAPARRPRRTTAPLTRLTAPPPAERSPRGPRVPACPVVGEAGDGQTAVRLAGELRPDVVILDVKMPVLDGIAAAQQIVEERVAPVVLLTAFSQRDLVERAREAGVMAYLVKPFEKGDLLPAVEMAVSRFAEVVALESEVADLRDRLEARTVIDRAKGVLQAQHGLTEPEAFRWIQRTSMDSRRTMRALAQDVLDGTASPAAAAAPPTG